MEINNTIWYANSEDINDMYNLTVNQAIERGLELLDYELAELALYERFINNNDKISDFDLCTLLKVIYNRGKTNTYAIKRMLNDEN